MTLRIDRKIFLIPILAVLFTLFFASSAHFASAQGKEAAPQFELKDLNDATVALSSFKGQKPVLLYFWATWCPYCLQARPAVVKMRGDIPQKDLEILAIDVGGGDSLAKVKRYQESHPTDFPVLYDTDSSVTRSYRVQGIPLFVLIDKDGNIRYRANELPPNPLQLLK